MPRALLTGWKRWVWFVGLLVVSLTIADYVAGINSDAMPFARKTLQESSILHRRIGPLRSVDLRWLWGFREKSGFAGDKATLYLSVTGTTGKERIVMDLQEVGGHWHVIRSSTPI